MAKQTPDIRSHNNNFDLLRLVFAVCVIVCHCSGVVPHKGGQDFLYAWTGTVSLGTIAVGFFFLLSGYLIVASWQKTPRAAIFTSKRIRRIYPAFVVAFLVSISIAALRGLPDGYFTSTTFRPLLFARDILTLQSPMHGAANAAMWSIRIEFLCYAMVLFMGVIGMLRSRTAWCVVWVVFYAVSLTNLGKYGYWAARITHHFPLFLMGGMYYLYRAKITFRSSYAWIALGVLTLGLTSDIGVAIALPVAGGYLLFYTAQLSSLRVLKPKHDISYGVYLYGFPAQALLMYFWPEMTVAPLTLFSVVVASLLGFASWKIVEEPFLKSNPQVALA